MAVAYLNPDGASGLGGWNTSYSQTASHLSQGETSNTWRNNFFDQGKATFTLSDFDNTGVASITKIENILVCALDARSGTSNVTCRIMSGISQLYVETFANPTTGGSYATFTGTARTTSDGSSAWTDSDLDGLGLQLICTAGPHVHIIQQYFIKVTYEEISGYSHDVSGVGSSNISKVNTVATANIAKIIGVD